jgi:glycosyltransferase involved in cell wall biosynthesis
MSVTLIVPCRNEAGTIEQCLRSAMAQQDCGADWEIIVADGLSEDGTRQILERLAAAEPRLRVIDNPKRIVSTGLNAAIRQARGEVILRLDAHTEYAPDYVRCCLEVLAQTRADNVGGPALTKTHAYLPRAIAAAYHSPFAVGGAGFHNPTREGPVDTVPYGCWRRSVFERFGCFDENLVRNQDDEHNLRIVRGGGTVWQSPRIRSWYRPRASLAALFEQYFQYGYWKVCVIRKHKLPASLRHLAPGSFLLALGLLAAASVLSVLTPLPLARAPWLLLWLAGLYAACVAAAALLTARQTDWKLLPVLPLVFVCYHFGYGCGFLRGMLHFIILRRGPAAGGNRLTRASHT